MTAPSPKSDRSARPNAPTSPAAGAAPKGVWPVMLTSDGWSDYALLDMGAGEKLERYGRLTIVRPEPQAMGSRKLDDAVWEAADAVFTGDTDEEGPGRWKFARKLPETWPMRYGDVGFLGRFTSFRHVGLFPEQDAHWRWMAEKIRGARRPVKVLNLFGYTGLASLVAAEAGAQVTHVDASKKAIGWARENQALSKLDDKPIRWICDDATKFVAREGRRGNTYDGILLDPPKYGRGPKGEVWQLFENLPEMVRLCREILAPDALFLVLTAYSIRASFLASHELLAETLSHRGGTIESGELALIEQGLDGAGGGRALSTSMFSRWSGQ
ncbi:class I SAM-dependent methyltransferase [Rhodobium gokarnense]|nr:class I SAM-dependent methyltransferase [Rhodobium gokarnense]